MFNSLVTPVAMDAIGWKYYTVYIVLLAQFLLVVYFFFPRRRGIVWSRLQVSSRDIS